MPALNIEPSDIEPFASIEEAKLDAMIADALAMARAVAPCVIDFDFEHADAAKAILRQAILRWNDANSGAVASQTAGPFQVTYESSARRSLFWPSEIQQLQKLCNKADSGGAWGYDTLGEPVLRHAEGCSVYFGAPCSCGAILTGKGPLWG